MKPIRNCLANKQSGQHSSLPTLSDEEISYLRSMVGSAHKAEKDSTPEPLLTTEEQVALLRSLGGPFTEAEADAVFQWAAKIRFDSAFLNLALRGWITISFRRDGQLAFKAVSPEAILAAGQRGGDAPA